MKRSLIRCIACRLTARSWEQVRFRMYPNGAFEASRLPSSATCVFRSTELLLDPSSPPPASMPEALVTDRSGWLSKAIGVWHDENLSSSPNMSPVQGLMLGARNQVTRSDICGRGKGRTPVTHSAWPHRVEFFTPISFTRPRPLRRQTKTTLKRRVGYI